jgi:hypothetical protein
MPIGKRRIATLLLCLVIGAVSSPASANASEDACGPMTPAEEELIKLRIDNNLLMKGIALCEAEKGISVERLRRKKAQRLKEIAVDVKLQRQAASDFEGFVTWMSANLAGYNRFIQAGSYAAVAARMLPVPYAGQASIFTKFLTQFTLSLNAASVSINSYLTSSQRFIAMADAIDPAQPLNEKALTEATQFADQKLLKDMNDAQTRLAALSDLSAGALSFLESINHYVCGTDEYWNKMKGVFKKDMDPKEKSFISESTGSLKVQADRFNGRLRSFGELGKKETAGVKALAVYDELAAEAAPPTEQ